MRSAVRQQRRAFTLIEAVLSMVIVSLMLTVALHTVGASQRSQRYGADQAMGLMLAEQLMSEILAHPYIDETGAGPLGPEGPEADGTRGSFDDVDDYAGWSASPPQAPGGGTISGVEGFGRKVQVDWVKLSDLATPVDAESGVKRISVYVGYNGRAVVTLSAICTETRDAHAALVDAP